MIREIDIPEMNKLVEAGALLVDVREQEEVDAGMIDGAEHWALSEFEAFETKVPKNKEIVFYCRSGRRSLKAAELAEKWTKQSLYSLSGGYLAYTAE